MHSRSSTRTPKAPVAVAVAIAARKAFHATLQLSMEICFPFDAREALTAASKLNNTGRRIGEGRERKRRENNFLAYIFFVTL